MFRLVPKAMVLVLLCSPSLAAAPPGLWLDVPFVMQERNGCGAASIAMVMQYWLQQGGGAAGESANATHIQRALYSSQAHGIYASDLERYFQNNGFRTFAFRADWEALRHHLEKGRPLIVALMTGDGGVASHYVVLAGLDWERQLVLINDPAERKLLRREWSSFEKQWNAAGNWTLLALPKQAGN